MKKIILICLVVITVKGYNQDTVKTTLIVFDKEDVDAITKGKDGKSNVQKNALKINPLLYVRGEIPIYYERALNNYLSVEAAIGMTFKDYTTGIFDDEISYDGESTEKVNNQVSFKLGLRYYTGGVVMDGFYFALEYAKRDYSKDITITSVDQNYNSSTNITTTTTTIRNFNETNSHNELKLIVGSQEHYYWDNVFIDYYVGVGIDKYSEKKVSVDYNTTTSQDKYSIKSKEETVPRFYLGLKIGFMF